MRSVDQHIIALAPNIPPFEPVILSPPDDLRVTDKMSSHSIHIPTIGAAQPHLFVVSPSTSADSLFAAQQHQLMSSPTVMSTASSSSGPISPSSSHGDLMTSSLIGGGAMLLPTAGSPLDDAEAAEAALKKHKPHKCDVCGASFARKVHLQRHSLRHQVCKPYSCERCGKCFSRQDSLVRHHRLLHEGGRDAGNSISANGMKKANSTHSSPAAKKQSSLSRKMSSAVFTSPVTYSPASTASTASASSMTTAPRCLRCSSVGVACDGKQPCAPCANNNGGRACCYTGISAMLRNRERQDSAATSTSSLQTTEDDEGDNNPWNTRRDTVSSVSSSLTAGDLTSPMLHSFNGLGLDFSGHLHHNVAQQQPFIYRTNAFGMPMQQQQEQFDAISADLAYLQHAGGDLKTVLDQQQQMASYEGSLFQAAAMQTGFYPVLQGVFPALAAQHQQGTFDFESVAATHASSMYATQPTQQHNDNTAVFDWAINLGSNAMDKLPFTGHASDKSLSATLFSDDLGASPAVHSTLITSTNLPNVASFNAAPPSSTGEFSQLGLYLAPPSASTSSASSSQLATPLHMDNHFDGLVRSLSSSHAVLRPMVGETVMV